MKRMKKIYMAFIALAAMLLCGCQEEERLTLGLDSGTDIIRLVMDGQYKGDIDHSKREVTVIVPEGYNLSKMTLTTLDISENADATVSEGEEMNMNYPQAICVSNGDVYSDWLVKARMGEVIPDEEEPDDENPGEGEENPGEGEETPGEGEETPGEGEENPGEGGNEGATYTKAFLGRGASLSDLGEESKAAGVWALANFEDMEYVDLQAILDGTVDINDYKMVWCHFDWTDWPSVMWDSRDIFNAYWRAGGNIFASRDGGRYINDVWRVTKNEAGPNDGTEGPGYSTIGEAGGGFACLTYGDHPIYTGITMTGEKNMVYLKSEGCSCTDRTLQWAVDRDPYFGMEGWMEKTGGVPLASNMDGDVNRVAIAEYPSRDGSGKVITIGTPFFEWHDYNNAENTYIENLYLLTRNAINYLSE